TRVRTLAKKRIWTLSHGVVAEARALVRVHESSVCSDCVGAGNHPASHHTSRHLDFAEMHQLEIFSRDGIFVSLAQETKLVGVLEIFDLCRETVELAVVGANRARVLYAAMHHLFFAVAPDL